MLDVHPADAVRDVRNLLRKVETRRARLLRRLAVSAGALYGRLLRILLRLRV